MTNLELAISGGINLLVLMYFTWDALRRRARSEITGWWHDPQQRTDVRRPTTSWRRACEQSLAASKERRSR